MSEDADRAEVPPDRFTALWRRIKGHRIAQWTVGYVAVAYGIQHAVILTSESFEWPNIVARVSMLLLALGLPVAMTLAWYHGERTARRISSGELAVVSVVLLGISFAFYLFIRPAADIAPRASAAQVASVTAARQAAANPHGAISVAVLPFVNLSSDKEQEFFSDGMTEEITSALAKVTGLNVVARTSAFQFKGENRDMRAIGQALGASHLIEGSVRKDGNEVRITAQLIKADNGTHLWTESYNRELKGVFALQEEIATAIAGALQVPLGLKQGDALVRNRTEDLESYQQYLRARALVRARTLDAAITILEPTVVRDPNYAPAWALLSQAYGLVPFVGLDQYRGSVDERRLLVQSSLDKAEMAARKAIQLDPRHVGGYTALARVQYVRGNWADAEDLFRQALTLDPNDPETLHFRSLQLADVGRVKESLRMREQLHTLEPFVPVYNLFAAQIMQVNGQSQASIPILEAMPPIIPGAPGERMLLAKAYAETGRYADAADALLTIRGDQIARQSAEAAARLIRTAPSIATAPEKLPVLEDGLGFVYASVGAYGRVFEVYERFLQTGVHAQVQVLWGPIFAPARKTERFKALMRANGLVDYWRAKGWPEFCHPTSGDDFVCS